MGGDVERDPRPPSNLADRVAASLAIAGGFLALGVALLVTASVLLRWSGSQPIPGDFEVVQMATAVAVFSFLPYCQLRRGNISVDTFTARLPQRLTASIDAFWDFVYAATVAVLAWCLFNGTSDMLRNGTTTMVTGLWIWPAIAICAALAAVLALTALLTGLRLLRGVAR
jgi:TRAP-type C4-dicarboxylate transport system permease small subunit